MTNSFLVEIKLGHYYLNTNVYIIQFIHFE